MDPISMWMIVRPSKMSRAVLVGLVLLTALSVVSAQIVTRAIIGEKPNETRSGVRGRVEVVSASSWDRLFTGNLTVNSREGVSILVIPVTKGDSRFPARYNITFIIPNHPENCNPNRTLWFSPAVYYEKLCMERDWTGKCTLPGGDGFTVQQQLVENYGNFKQVVFDYEIPEIPSYKFRIQSRAAEVKRKQTIKKTLRGAIPSAVTSCLVMSGSFCYDDRDYWMAFSTSCPQPIEIKIEVGVKDINFVEKWTCRGFDYFMIAQHGSDAFLTSRLFWAIIIPIGYFALLTVVIFGTCYLCPCGAALKPSTLLNVNLPFDIFDSDDESEDEKKPKARKSRRRKK